MIFQEPMTSLNPVLHRRRPDRRGVRLHEGLSRRRRWTARGRDADLVGIPRPARRVRLPAPVLRRHAPARDDRHRAGLQPQLLIADEPTTGARRHHPGADPRPDRRSWRALGGGDADHPRPGRGRRGGAEGGGDVCRQGGRGSAGARPSRAQHPYTPGLIRSIPRVDPVRASARGSKRSPARCPLVAGSSSGCRPGCRFAAAAAGRRPAAAARTPPLREGGTGAWVRLQSRDGNWPG